MAGTTRHRLVWLAVGLLVLLGAATGMAFRTREKRPSPRVREPVFAESDAPFPSDTAADVVSFADHVALVTAVAEKAVPTTSPTASAAGSTAVARDVTFRVDRVLWSHRTCPRRPRG
ncbi:MAG TPA: hypothetical protein VFQ85_04725 [Mycobacteriales bacterium]|jgi:hypothetical protein|nr:hypothetical protein [Mycobacteriales bacterium]